MNKSVVENELTDNIIKELYVRFILNLPESYKKKLEENFYRIFFELEHAYWFYLDYFIDNTSSAVDFTGFCKKFFQVYPNVVSKKQDWYTGYQYWRSYRTHTPTGSAILFNDSLEKILLVRGFNSNKWCFPGGKLDENESFLDCAIREVREETGYDIEQQSHDWLHLDFKREETVHRAFIVEGVPETAEFKPTTKFEIEAITWFPLVDLPETRTDNRVKQHFGLNPDAFFLLMPYVGPLKEYVNNRKKYDKSASFKLINENTRPRRQPKNKSTSISLPSSTQGQVIKTKAPPKSKGPYSHFEFIKFGKNLNPEEPLSYLRNIQFNYDAIGKKLFF